MFYAANVYVLDREGALTMPGQNWKKHPEQYRFDWTPTKKVARAWENCPDHELFLDEILDLTRNESDLAFILNEITTWGIGDRWEYKESLIKVLERAQKLGYL